MDLIWKNCGALFVVVAVIVAVVVVVVVAAAAATVVMYVVVVWLSGRVVRYWTCDQRIAV